MVCEEISQGVQAMPESIEIKTDKRYRPAWKKEGTGWGEERKGRKKKGVLMVVARSQS